MEPLAGVALAIYAFVGAFRHCGSSSLPQTEAESLRFKLASLKLLDEKGAKKIKRLLRDVRILGAWKSNVTFLLELNSRLAIGGVVFIDNFLDTSFAKVLYHEMVWLSGNESFTLLRPPSDYERGSVSDLDGYFSAGAALARCDLLHARLSQQGIEYQFHQLAPAVGRSKAKDKDYLAFQVVAQSMMQRQWLQALNLLLTGSGLRVLSRFQDRVKSFTHFREYSPNDYILLHTDRIEPPMLRALSVNYWLPTPGWRPHWGGGMLWCGAEKEHAKRYAGPSPSVFPVAFNKAALFVPTPFFSYHAVEPVKASRNPAYHRFSITTFLTTSDIDADKHYKAIRAGILSRPHLSEQDQGEL